MGHNELNPFSKDVTHAYKAPNRIKILNRWEQDLSGRDVYLMVFNQKRGWFPVDKARSVNNQASFFENISSDVVFWAAFDDGSDKLQPLNYPFIVDGQQRVSYLDLTGTMIDSVTLLRKYPPYHVWRMDKLRRIKSVNGLKIQASDTPSFSPHRDIITIRDFNSTQVQTIPLTYKGKYRYYRIAKPDTAWLATLRLVGEHDPVERHGHNSDGPFGMDNLTDEDPLTFRGGREVELRYVFDKPVKISSIEVQARNDDNHIRPGDRYELMYWDKTWRSLGSRVAGDTLLEYDNVPEDALYWLRNHSRGKEEHVFTITGKGKQWWPGVSNYAGSLDDTR